ncbi:polyprenyl synthetase family protein [Irregularibacter muris]|uniref:Farnesyl diphosphate synthase n=1 Tax=Irregularibacter muris TaxID=1796619 RepID=A0AAE3HDE7_9FIRM|nr:farnesyl diphosphate synthase [Irregularibacter muris]MCR1898001.1 polyprenyl synthetase family protein [Irregularibacter muris]
MTFNKRLKAYVEEIDQYLKNALPKEQEIPDVLIQSMEYSVFAGGKRLRPILLLEAIKCIDENKRAQAIPLACALEMIHTYSLIHDDLPAMDNDDFRRGKPTNHKVYGEGMAVLTGDALLNYSFELMLNNVPFNTEREKDNYIRAIQEIAKAAGIFGMIGGQTKDLECENQGLNFETLQYIHSHKTGALIRASLRAGAMCAGANEKQLEALTLFGEKIGLAFQIVDDILDIIGDETKLGKRVGSDDKNKKLTYPSIYGLEESKKMVEELLNEALKAIELFGAKSEFIGELGKFICIRDY